MRIPQYPHQILPPSSRYSTWQGEADDGLVYLGWGERNFSRETIPVHSNPGWTYWTLLDGEVEAQFPDGLKRFHPGQGLLCGPDLPFGFPEQQLGPIKILIWIWREAPRRDETASPHLQESLSFSHDQLRLLAALHEQTRIETLESHHESDPALQHIRNLVDLTFRRASEAHNNSSGQSRIRSARLWMLNNLDRANPAAALARFLNVSTMTLHRLFISELGESPGAYFQKLKMEQSQRLLKQEGHSVKSVAYEMGYKHPQDFSRAYKTYFGSPPTQA